MFKFSQQLKKKEREKNIVFFWVRTQKSDQTPRWRLGSLREDLQVAGGRVPGKGKYILSLKGMGVGRQ